MPNNHLPRAPLATALAGALLGALLAGCAGRHAPALPETVTPRAAQARAVGTLEHDVDLLASDDFVTRAEAAERLVRYGESALPALGRAGEAYVVVPGGSQVSTTRPVIRSILTDASYDRVRANLAAPWPVVRREAAEELGQRGRVSAVPDLMEGMDDDDADVRGAAASSLRRLTNQFFGFRARADVRTRAAASRRWHEWWNVEGRLKVDTPHEGRSG